jgi:hypothetical protein
MRSKISAVVLAQAIPFVIVAEALARSSWS